MAADDHLTSPLNEQIGIEGVVKGLAESISALRAGTLAVPVAVAQAELAKQFFNGVRLIVTAQKFLHGAAKPITAIEPPTDAE